MKGGDAGERQASDEDTALACKKLFWGCRALQPWKKNKMVHLTRENPGGRWCREASGHAEVESARATSHRDDRVDNNRQRGRPIVASPSASPVSADARQRRGRNPAECSAMMFLGFTGDRPDPVKTEGSPE